MNGVTVVENDAQGNVTNWFALSFPLMTGPTVTIPTGQRFSVMSVKFSRLDKPTEFALEICHGGEKVSTFHGTFHTGGNGKPMFVVVAR